MRKKLYKYQHPKRLGHLAFFTQGQLDRFRKEIERRLSYFKSICIYYFDDLTIFDFEELEARIAEKAYKQKYGELPKGWVSKNAQVTVLDKYFKH